MLLWQGMRYPPSPLGQRGIFNFAMQAGARHFDCFIQATLPPPPTLLPGLNFRTAHMRFLQIDYVLV